MPKSKKYLFFFISNTLENYIKKNLLRYIEKLKPEVIIEFAGFVCIETSTKPEDRLQLNFHRIDHAARLLHNFFIKRNELSSWAVP